MCKSGYLKKPIGGFMTGAARKKKKKKYVYANSAADVAQRSAFAVRDHSTSYAEWQMEHERFLQERLDLANPIEDGLPN